MNDQNLVPNSARTPSQRRANASKAGKASVQARKEKKTLSQIVQMWAEHETSEANKVALAKLGITDTSQKATLVLPLLQNVKNGSLKAMELVVQLLGEDKKREAEIARLISETERLNAETERLKAENELLRNGGTDYEDLTPLSELIKIEDEDSDD